MDEKIYQKIQELEIKIDKIYKTTETAKKMFVWSLVLNLLFFVMPLIILIFILPTLMSTISGMYSGLL